MKLKRITPEDVMELEPCFPPYDLKYVEKLFGKRKTLNALNILGINDISIEDRFWVVLRDDMLPDRIFHEFACDCAEHVLHLFEDKYPTDKRPREAIEAKRKWINGEITDEELATARDAAWAAARAAAWAAAWNADRAAARAAVWATDRAAARAAAWATDRAAAGDAAWDAAYEWMLKRLIELIKEDLAK